ncbi:MAG: hypothetical protein K9K93_01755 [Acholeplasmataceae bacterium]|nr:hypothetical protein [Acholeplasmataceae bacterium]
MNPNKRKRVLFLYLMIVVFLLYLEFVFKLSIVGFPKIEYSYRVVFV